MECQDRENGAPVHKEWRARTEIMECRDRNDGVPGQKEWSVGT